MELKAKDKILGNSKFWKPVSNDIMSIDYVLKQHC